MEASTAALAAEDAALKVAAMGRRVAAAEGLPSMERTRVAVSSAVQVKNYVLGVKAAYALPTGATALLKASRPSEAARAAGATDDVDAYDRRRRRHGYPTLPGFQEKGAMDARAEPKDHLRVLADLDLARSGGGLVRTFVVNGFNGQDDERAHHNTINEAAFSLDEMRVASASADCSVRLWDLQSGRLIATLEGHTEAVNCVCFSDEGQRLVSAGLDNFLVVWNEASGEVLRRLYGHDDQVNRVRLFNDSTGIVSCSGDLTLKVWYLTPQPPAAPAKPQVM